MDGLRRVRRPWRIDLDVGLIRPRRQAGRVVVHRVGVGPARRDAAGRDDGRDPGDSGALRERVAELPAAHVLHPERVARRGLALLAARIERGRAVADHRHGRRVDRQGHVDGLRRVRRPWRIDRDIRLVGPRGETRRAVVDCVGGVLARRAAASGVDRRDPRGALRHRVVQGPVPRVPDLERLARRILPLHAARRAHRRTHRKQCCRVRHTHRVSNHPSVCIIADLHPRLYPTLETVHTQLQPGTAP